MNTDIKTIARASILILVASVLHAGLYADNENIYAEDENTIDAEEVESIDPQTIDSVDTPIEEAKDPHLEEIQNSLLPDEQEIVEKLDKIKAEFPGPAESPSIFELLVVTKRDNPLITEACRKEAENFMLDALTEKKDTSRDEAVAAADEHIKEMQKIFSQENISHADYLQHVSVCEVFCRPIVATLINCHVNAVSNLERSIVLFDFDSEAIKPGYSVGTIDRLARILRRDPSKNVMLIGRASRIGSLEYNKALSTRRTLAVQEALATKGVPYKQIRPKWFGWEEPQIRPWIATEYGFDSQFGEFGMQMMNQSVMLVLF